MGLVLQNPSLTGLYVTYQFGKWLPSSKPEEKEEPKIDLVPFPTGSPSVFHFHPTAFVEQMRKLGIPFLFPYKFRVDSYKTGFGYFGAKRTTKTGGTRKHAGCDLYAAIGTEVLAVRDGVVMCDLQYFDIGTYQIVIDHGDFICRYTEIQDRRVPGITQNSRVEQGQVIGYVGLTTVTNQPMLHLEMYKIKDSQKLYNQPANIIFTDRSNEYRRIEDLIDPTKWLNKGEIL